MKYTHTLLLLAAGILIISSCCHPKPPTTCAADAEYQSKHTGNGHGHGTGGGSQFIPMDSANKMITSYQASVNGNGPTVDTAINSLIIDANVLRSYLNDSCNGNITQVKLMFAHTLDYINAGNFGRYAGYKPGAFTVVVAGYDAYGNYVMAQGMTVLDETQSCPALCPKSGAAANSYIIIPQHNK